MALTEDHVMHALMPIQDPELHLGIVELGLIYGVHIEEDPDTGTEVRVTMTFTSPFCPYGPQLKASVQATLENISEVKKGVVSIVFTPPWDPRTMASEDCKVALGLGWDDDDEL